VISCIFEYHIPNLVKLGVRWW